MIRKWFIFLFVGVLSVSFFSCSDEEPSSTEYDYDKHYVDNQPTEDKIENVFNGKVAILQPNSDNVVGYLTKRIINTTVELVDDADVVVLDESRAHSILNTAEYETLKKMWDYNKIVVFINPGAEAYTLIKKLQSSDYAGSPSVEDLVQFKDVHIYATRADGTSFYHERMDAVSSPYESVIVRTTDNESTKETVATTPHIAELNDYLRGRVADNLAEWLSDNVVIGQSRHVAFSRADSYCVKSAELTFYRPITVTHDWVKEYCEDADKIPGPTTVDAKYKITIYGVYDVDKQCDIYDINMYEDFPADKTFVDDVYIYEHLAYNYKYTGGCYIGPESKLYLIDIPESTIEVEEVAPLPMTNGQYNNTHYPAQISLGASGGVDISDPPGLSLGLSMGVTLPTTTISFNHAEMPISFSNTNKHAEWVYNVDLDIYTCRAGFNAVVNDYPDIVHEYCHTDQAVTFLVSDTKSFGKNDVKLQWDIKQTVQSQYAGIWEGILHWDYYYDYHTITLPKVYRYFEKYSPYPLPGYGGTADGAEWSNLEAYLMSNVNYRALSDETLKVGAQIESDLDKTAESIWRNAIESLVNQYNGTTTTNDYVVALARTDGTHIGLGLYIQKDGTWRLVEDVDNITK